MSEDEWLETVYFDVNKFLEEYEKYPCLWDRNHPKFRDRKERLLREENLGEILGITDLKTLRRKIRSVRGTYNTEIRKLKVAIESGYEIYAPRLSWFPLADRFLRVTTDLTFEEFPLLEWDKSSLLLPKNKKLKHSKAKDVTLNLEAPNGLKRQKLSNREDTYQHESSTTQEFDEAFQEFDELESEVDNCVKYEVLDDFGSEQEEIEESAASTASRPADPSKAKDQNTSKTVVEYLKNLTKANENEFMAFGRSIGVQLQTLPLEVALQLQMDIQAHITKSRLQYLRSKMSEDQS